MRKNGHQLSKKGIRGKQEQEKGTIFMTETTPGALRLHYPDGHIEKVYTSSPTADFSATGTQENGIHTLTLTPLRPGLSLVAVEYDIPVPQALTDQPEQLFIYDDSAHTNDFTDVVPYIGNEKRTIWNMAVFKNLQNRQVFLCGFVTAHRFLAELHLHDGIITLRFDLEERALNAGEAYRLERFLCAQGTDNEKDLLLDYGHAIAVCNNARPDKALPVGWCSWSCYYGGVNEERIRRAADSQIAYAKPQAANLIQIDDGWQRGGSFCGKWVPDADKFPSGLEATAQYVRDRGMVFGLWLAPWLLDDQSEYYRELKHLARDEVTLGDHNHPFELGDPAYREHLRTTFREMVDRYGARYFKLDFLAAAIRFFNGKGSFVRFRDGFRMEVLRGALQTVRDAVGPDVFLLLCGAPMLIGAGITDGSRTSADIIWGKNKNNPSYWDVMKRCMATVSRRYFYHRCVYINDPDGVVLRDVDTGDGFNCTYSEAELWAVSVAMSGGEVLSNDELERLSPGRRKLFTQLLPPIGIAGRPVDFFENPHPTASVLDFDERTKFLALYNLSDRMTDLSFDLADIGMDGALAVNCLTHKPIGFRDTLTFDNVNPHGAVMVMLRKPSDVPTFAFADDSVFCGVNTVQASFENGTLSVEKPENCVHVYVVAPTGQGPDGEIVLRERGYALIKI